MCVCLWAKGGEGRRKGIVYLYNLSNSLVLISEGHLNISGSPCGLAASFLLSVLLWGCVCKDGAAGTPYTWYIQGSCVPHQATLPRASLYGNNITLQGRDVSASFGWALAFQSLG